MKTISSIILKGLLVIVLFTGATIALSTMGARTVSEARAEVKDFEIQAYLENLGYTVWTTAPIENSEDWICRTTLNGVNYLTTVHVKDSQIIDHEDSSI
jgi:hypothetical protein